MANRFSNSPWWLKVTAIWLATRVLTTSIMLFAASLQGQSYWTNAQPGYFEFAGFWDSEWFDRIFDHGYPIELPTNPDGTVRQNEWAFLPLFPGLVRMFDLATGLGWKVLAPILAVLFSFVAALVIYRLFLRVLAPAVALWAVALVGLWLASPVLQVGYAESLGLVFLAGTLLWIFDRKYLLALIPLTMFTFTRPGSIAFALLLVLVFVSRLRAESNSFALAERIRLGVAAGGATVLGFAWVLVAWVCTGRSDAYLTTEMSWRAGYGTGTSFVPFTGWIGAFNYFFGNPVGWFALATLMAWLIWMFTWPSVRALGALRLWAIAYLVYLLAVFFPQSSIWRILFPCFVLAGALATRVTKLSRWAQVLMVVAAAALQFWWMLNCWNYTAPDFTPP